MSFRRNKNKLLHRHINRDYDNVRTDVDDIQDTVDNDSIMNIINPVSVNLDMNNNNIDNVNLINGGGILVNPLINNLDINNNDLLNVEKLENLNAPVGSEAQITVSTPNGITRLEGLELEMAYGFTDYLNGDIKNLGSLAVKGIILNTAPPGPSSIEFLNDIDLKNNEIKNVGLLNNCILVRSEADLPHPNITSGNYIIMDNITCIRRYFIDDNVSIFGLGREGKSSLNFVNTDPFPAFCITIVDANVCFSNIRITNQSSVYDLMNCVNNAKDKVLTFSNCSITDCKNQNVMIIGGFDLVDLHQCLFQYNNPSNIHFRHTDGSKLQISNCEFLRQLERGSSPINYGTSNMIELRGTFGAINITGNLLHPQQSQDGIYIFNTLTALEAVIASNTFISVGLTTGILINYNTSINQYPFLIVSDNTGVINEKALLEGSSNNNTTYTSTVLNTYVPVDFGASFNILNIERFIQTSGYEFKYTAKQPIKVLVNINQSCDHSTGGSDTILFALFVNGVLANNIQTDISSGSLKTFGFNTIVSLVQNSVLEFRVQNLTAGTNTNGFRCVSFNGSLVEV